MVRGFSFCGLLEDLSTSNPFHQCILNEESTAPDFMDNCVYDVCIHTNETVMKEAACKSLAVFAAVCENLGYVDEWRVDAGCGKMINYFVQFYYVRY